MGKPRRVSVVIVTYQSRDEVADALAAVRRAADRAGAPLDIVVIDNASSDGSADHVAEVAVDARIVRNGENVGFARACNQGFTLATGHWWLLLNPDARPREDALGHLLAFMEAHPSVGAAAPMLTGAGTDRAESAGMQPGIRAAIGHFLFVNRLLPGNRGGPWRGFQVQRRPTLGPRRVDWASGAALLLRPEAVRAVEGFDPSFFLYAEDVDLGRRLAAAGWETWLVPDARVAHSVAASQGGVSDRWFVALHDYYANAASHGRVVLFDLIAAMGLAVRALVARRDGLHRERMVVAARAALRAAFGRTR